MGLDFSKIADKLSSVFSGSSKKITPETVKKIEGAVEGGTEKIQSSLEALAQNNKPIVKTSTLAASEQVDLINRAKAGEILRANLYPISAPLNYEVQFRHFSHTAEPIEKVILKKAVEESIKDEQKVADEAKKFLDYLNYLLKIPPYTAIDERNILVNRVDSKSLLSLKEAAEEAIKDKLNEQQALNGAKELLAAMGKRTNESAKAAAKVFEEAGLTKAEISLNNAETEALNKLLEQ